jgi:BASS family bile acid:Na+ symporter
MTTVSTILSPILTPALVLALAGTSVDVNAIGMFKNILFVTLLPVTGGCLLNWLLSNKSYFGKIKATLPGISVICLCLIVGGVISKVRPQLIENGLQLFLLTLGVVFCHNTLGYILGYLTGRLFKFNTAKKRTLCIEIGMQNAGMATVLANNFFATPAAIAANPLAALSIIPCAISCAYHSISGTIIANLFLLFDKRRS